MCETNVTRRGFLAGVVYLVSSQLLPWAVDLDVFHPAGEPDVLAKKLANFYADRKSVQIIGQAYLHLVPSEARVDSLVDCVCSFNARQRTELAEADENKLKHLLLLRQRQDFEDERCVNIGGWILSETECRLCALAVLTKA